MQVSEAYCGRDIFFDVREWGLMGMGDKRLEWSKSDFLITLIDVLRKLNFSL